MSSLCILSGYKSCVRRGGLKFCWLFHLHDMYTQLEIGLHLFIFVASIVGNLPKHHCLSQNFRDSPISNLIASDFTFGVSIYFVLDSYILRKGKYFIPLISYIQFSTIVCWSVCLSCIYSWHHYQISVIHTMWILVLYSVILSLCLFIWHCCVAMTTIAFAIHTYIHTYIHIHVHTYTFIHTFIYA